MTSNISSQGWSAKFRNAFRGIVMGIRGENSFYVHLPAAIAVLSLALLLRLDWIRVCVLVLCVAAVIVSELFNSCLEQMAKAITTEQDKNVGTALDIASGAVLVTAGFSAVIGAVILGPPLVGFFLGH